MNKDNLTIQDLLGKRILLEPLGCQPYETTVTELSPSGNYCCLDGDRWQPAVFVIISLAEILG